MVEQVYSSEKSQVCGSWVSVCKLGCFYKRVTNHVCLVCLNSVDIFSALMILHTVQALLCCCLEYGSQVFMLHISYFILVYKPFFSNNTDLVTVSWLRSHDSFTTEYHI